jgi:DNA-binding IclR family transcriptional regulator
VRTLPRVTDRTVTSRSRLRAELAQVREVGYALAVDELEDGLSAAAAPIRNAHGDIVASMSLSGPTYRLTEAKLEQVVPMLVAAATEVSHRLGWGQRV